MPIAWATRCRRLASLRPTFDMAANTKNQIFIFDATLSEAKNSADEIKAFGRAHCDKWVFQLEQGENPQEGQPGYLHFQCRFKLRERQRKTGMLMLMQQSNLLVHPNAVRPTSQRAASKAVWTYVMKTETRVEGPWTDRDVDPAILPLRLRLPYTQPNGWQQAVLQMPFDDRTVHFIVNEAGHAGKSTFGQSHARCHPDDWVYLKVNLKDTREIAEAIVAKYNNGTEFRDMTIFINVPRGCAASMNKKEAMQFCNLLEALKDGHMTDRRYSFKEVFLGATRLIVVSNEAIPHTSEFLSADRARYYRITPSMNLVPVRLWLPAPLSRDDLDQELYAVPRMAERADSAMAYPGDDDDLEELLGL